MPPLPPSTNRPGPRGRDRRLARVMVWLALAFLLTAGLASPAAADAPRIDTSEPDSGASVATSPKLIQITFDDPFATDREPAAIAVFGRGGAPVALGPTMVTSADQRTIAAPVTAPLDPGTYVVQWTIVPGEAAAPSTGAYAFRVAAASIPGGASGDDGLPALWAVITRLLTLIGLALSLGGLTLARFTRGLAPANDHRRRWLTVGGAILALVSTLAEPLLAMLLRDSSPGFLEVVAAYPAWWPRTIALAGLAAVSAVLAARPVRGGAGNRVLWAAGVGLGAVALAATSLATLSAQLSPVNPVADVLMMLLQVILVVLAGIAIHLALATPAPGPPGTAATSEQVITQVAQPGRRMLLRFVAALAGVGLAGLAAIGVLLPSGVGGLVDGLFGWVLIAVAALLAVILLLSLLARGADRAGPVRLVAGLATLSLLGSAVLALSPAPGQAVAGGALAAVDVVAPVDHEVAGLPGRVHLLYQPTEPGENTFFTWLTNADGAVLSAEEQPTFTLEVASLTQPTPPLHLAPDPVAPGEFATAPGTLPHPGWWQVNVTATLPQGEPVVANFYLLLPDPNVTGQGPEPATTDGARAVFDRGLAAMTSLRHVQFRTLIGSGGGTFAESNIIINDPGDAAGRTYREVSARHEIVIVGNESWLRQGDAGWAERPAGYVFTPAEWGITYEHATGFTLGPVVELNGEATQVVSFWLPRQENPRQEAAWFAWWVGTESGQVHREAMISTQHYMVYDFANFDQPVEITPPDTTPPLAATPAAATPISN